jgi:hypothetical protein
MDCSNETSLRSTGGTSPSLFPGEDFAPAWPADLTRHFGAAARTSNLLAQIIKRILHLICDIW